jgi:hypothetical protein
MIVGQKMLPLPNSAWSWSSDQSGGAARRDATAGPQEPHQQKDSDRPYPLVSSPPLITRILPGL